MSIVDHETSIEVPYKTVDVYNAIKEVAIYNHYHDFEFDYEDETLKIIYLKTRISMFSWGENIQISVEQGTNNNTKIKIISTPKTGAMLGGLFDMGKNKKNIQALLSEISIELQKYPKTECNVNKEDNFEQLEKLFNLKEKGIITQEEFEQQKQKLLK